MIELIVAASIATAHCDNIKDTVQNIVEIRNKYSPCMIIMRKVEEKIHEIKMNGLADKNK